LESGSHDSRGEMMKINHSNREQLKMAIKAQKDANMKHDVYEAATRVAGGLTAIKKLEEKLAEQKETRKTLIAEAKKAKATDMEDKLAAATRAGLIVKELDNELKEMRKKVNEAAEPIYEALQMWEGDNASSDNELLEVAFAASDTLKDYLDHLVTRKGQIEL